MNTKAAARKYKLYKVFTSNVITYKNCLTLELYCYFLFFFIHIIILSDDPNMIEARLAGEATKTFLGLFNSKAE